MSKLLNEIKKELYKQKPNAMVKKCISEYNVYEAKLKVVNSVIRVEFKVPIKEAANFKTTEPAQLLIRWL